VSDRSGKESDRGSASYRPERLAALVRTLAARRGLEVRAVLLGTPNDFAAYNDIDVPVAVNLADRRSLSADWPRRGRRERLACGDRDIRARRRAPPARQ
jgi:hypothetical protein